MVAFPAVMSNGPCPRMGIQMASGPVDPAALTSLEISKLKRGQQSLCPASGMIRVEMY